MERGVSRGGVLEFFPKLSQLPVRHPFLGVSALWGLFLGSRRVVLGAAAELAGFGGWVFFPDVCGWRARTGDDPRAGLTLSVPISEGLLVSGHAACLKVKIYIVAITPHSTFILCFK